MKLDTTFQFQLNDMMKDVKGYRGCFAKDWCYDQTPWKEEYLILNTNDSSHNSGHWICICNRPDSPYIEYFDSFGLPAPEAMLAYMKRSGKPVVSTTNEIQAFDSNACGYYCIHYLRSRAKGIDPYDILYSFALDEGKRNERLLGEHFTPSGKEPEGELYLWHLKKQMEGDGIRDLVVKAVIHLFNEQNFAGLFLSTVKSVFPSFYPQAEAILGRLGIGGKGLVDRLKGLSKKVIVQVLNEAVDKFAQGSSRAPLKELIAKMSQFSGEGFNIGEYSRYIRKKLMDEGYSKAEIDQVIGKRGKKKPNFDERQRDILHGLEKWTRDAREDYWTNGDKSEFWIDLPPPNPLIPKVAGLRQKEWVRKMNLEGKELRKGSKESHYHRLLKEVGKAVRYAHGHKAEGEVEFGTKNGGVKFMSEGRPSHPEILAQLAAELEGGERVELPKKPMSEYLVFSSQFEGYTFDDIEPKDRQGIIGALWNKAKETREFNGKKLATEAGLTLVPIEKRLKEVRVTKEIIRKAQKRGRKKTAYELEREGRTEHREITEEQPRRRTRRTVRMEREAAAGSGYGYY